MAAREAATQLSHLNVNKFPLGFTTGGKYCLPRHMLLDRSCCGQRQLQNCLAIPQFYHAADEKTDVAATILRMLYIKDLRGLQTIIDETLVNVQVSCDLHSLASTTKCKQS